MTLRIKGRIPATLLLAGFLIFLLLVLVAIAGLALSISGRKQWERTKSDLLSRGEKLTFAELIGPKVPDAENFFAAPLWRDTFDLVPADGGYGWKPRKADNERATAALLYADTP